MKTEIVGQKDREDIVSQYLLSIWVKVRIEILQMSPTIVPTASTEELGLITRLMRQYGTITPAEFAECIRLAAIQKQKELAAKLQTFPTLYGADFEDEIQQLTLRKMKANAEVLSLPANTGGNQFFGEPSEALSREWPRIKAQTELLRKTINANMRDRFWYGGAQPQRDAARAMLGQMVHDMKQAGVWDQRQHEWEMLAIFQGEYRNAYTGWERLIEQGMEPPLTAAVVAELRRRTELKISNTVANGGTPPSIELFPDPLDCTFCAIFDAYWKFWEGLRHAD